MNTSNFPDANVWLALIWARHQHSEIARAWFNEREEERFLFCRFTQLTVLRLLTTASVMGRDVQTMKGAWALWNNIGSDDRIGFLPEPEDLDLRFRKYSSLATVSPKVWADAYVLAFAHTAGLRLVTFDRALGRGVADGVVLG